MNPVQSNCNLRHRRTGFTLIELLVVIAIIALLAAILFPAFSRAREKARQASCLNNLKQLGIGIMQYTQDYDEKYPPFWVQANGVWGATIVDVIEPYTKSRAIWACPSQSTVPIQPYVNTGINSPSWPYHYTVNYQIIGFGWSLNLQPKALAEVADPSGTLMMFCWPGTGTGDTLFLGSADNIILKRTAVMAAGLPDPLKHHNQGSQILYADAHAKWKPPSAILTESTWTPEAD